MYSPYIGHIPELRRVLILVHTTTLILIRAMIACITLMIFYLSTKSYKDQKKNSLNDRSTLACLKAIYYQGLSGRLCVCMLW